jgi:hypothetical protein
MRFGVFSAPLAIEFVHEFLRQFNVHANAAELAASIEPSMRGKDVVELIAVLSEALQPSTMTRNNG